MKHLLTSVAVIAALALAAPVGAQPSPSGGNSMGTPGPNPGGPGLTPYSTSAPPLAPAPSGRMPAGGRATSEPTNIPPTPSASAATSATPPMHRHARQAAHGKMARHHSKGPQLSGGTANQLNQEELTRLQAGNFSNPAAPPASEMAPPPTSSANRMPAGGRATSDRYGR